jgi:hypothetical protein
VHGIQIEKVGLTEIDAMEYFAQVLAPAGGKIIDAPNLVAAIQESADERRSDESGGACH